MESQIEIPKEYKLIDNDIKKGLFLLGTLTQNLTDAGILPVDWRDGKLPKSYLKDGLYLREFFPQWFDYIRGIITMRELNHLNVVVKEIERCLKSYPSKESLEEINLLFVTGEITGSKKVNILPDVLTPAEAAEEWGLKENTVRAALARGRFKRQVERCLVRRSAGTWLITRQAMREVFGEPKRSR